MGCPSTILPVDALAEIPVTGSPEAEFGRSSGATVNIVTKSGSNVIHGSAFEYFRDGALAARNYFNTVAQPKNSFTNHQFGGLIDGPILKDTRSSLSPMKAREKTAVCLSWALCPRSPTSTLLPPAAQPSTP